MPRHAHSLQNVAILPMSRVGACARPAVICARFEPCHKEMNTENRCLVLQNESYLGNVGKPTNKHGPRRQHAVNTSRVPRISPSDPLPKIRLACSSGVWSASASFLRRHRLTLVCKVLSVTAPSGFSVR